MIEIGILMNLREYNRFTDKNSFAPKRKIPEIRTVESSIVPIMLLICSIFFTTKVTTKKATAIIQIHLNTPINLLEKKLLGFIKLVK